uniref:RING-type domain-containing protein n=1 Tax=Trichogramma kaykai TaxID=54128 RepID=A0ABD2VUG3_9HYME
MAALNGEEPSAALNEEPLAASNQEEPVIELDPEPVEHIVTPIRAPVFPRIPNFLDEELPVFRLPPFIPFESSFLNLLEQECELIGCDSRRDIIKLKCKHRFCIPCIRNFMTRFCVTCREPIGNYLPDHLMGGETWTKKVDQQLDRDFYRQINNERIALETQADGTYYNSLIKNIYLSFDNTGLH